MLAYVDITLTVTTDVNEDTWLIIDRYHFEICDLTGPWPARVWQHIDQYMELMGG